MSFRYFFEILADGDRVLAHAIRITVQQLEKITEHAGGLSTVQFLDNQTIWSIRILECLNQYPSEWTWLESIFDVLIGSVHHWLVRAYELRMQIIRIECHTFYIPMELLLSLFV